MYFILWVKLTRSLQRFIYKSPNSVFSESPSTRRNDFISLWIFSKFLEGQLLQMLVMLEVSAMELFQFGLCKSDSMNHWFIWMESLGVSKSDIFDAIRSEKSFVIFFRHCIALLKCFSAFYICYILLRTTGSCGISRSSHIQLRHKGWKYIFHY